MQFLQYDFIDLRDFSDADYALAIELASPEKRERILRLAADDDRRRSAAADYLARRMISKHFGISMSAFSLTNLESGQPVVSVPNCHISLSHSGHLAMCALSHTAVGADIETVSDRGRRISQKVCNEAEYAYVCPDGEFDAVRFTQVWTAKEACLKLSGKGLSGGIGTTPVADRNGLFSKIDGHTLVCGSIDHSIFAVIG